VRFDVRVNQDLADAGGTWHVQADSHTVYKGNCRDLAGAKNATVTGTQQGDRSLFAQTIEVKK